MRDHLNAGTGQCQGTARLLIKPVRAVIELGAAGDVLLKTLNAVHHANRHGSMEDLMAVAFPTMRMGRNCMMPGHEIELIGSETCLSILLGMDVMAALKRRGMLNGTEIGETFKDEGLAGAAYVRDRACEKPTQGWIRRSIARAERRNKPVGKAVKARGNELSTLVLRYGQAVLHVRELPGEISNAPLMVSTYGFSSPGARAVLPVMPEFVREAYDTA